MVREVLSFGIGECGIQIGYELWKQYGAEHQISPKGKYDNYLKIGPTKQINPDQSYRCLYEESDSSQFVARNIFIDTEQNVIDNIKTSIYKDMFNAQFLISGIEDAANNYSRGHYSIGLEIIDLINEAIRKQMNHCENLQGFIITHSVGGGTGSGLTSLILQNLSNDYRKKMKLGFDIYPSPIMSTCVVEPYNALLTTHYLLNHMEICLVLDNEAIYEIVQRDLDINRPSYDNLNKLISKTLSSMTAGLRYDGDIYCDLNEIQTNLVAFPRLHFMIESMAPICSPQKMETKTCGVQEITDSCYDSSNFFVKMIDFDHDEDKYMAISEVYRGSVAAKEANATIPWLKCNKKCQFVEWCPTGFKVGLYNEPLTILSDDDMAFSNKHITMIGNNTGISRVFANRISKKYDIMYSQRAFVHWYIAEGMEQCQFEEAREDLQCLEKDYLEVLVEMDTDDDMESDEESY